jgi:hypothetical protein
MSPDPFAKRPYLDWTLDRWKTGVILLVFSGLVISSLARSAAGLDNTQIALRPAPTAAQTARVLAGTDAPPAAPVAGTVPEVTAVAPTRAAPAQAPGQTVAPAATLAAGAPTVGPTVASAVAPTTTLPAVSPTPVSASADLLFPLTLANISPNAIVPAHSIRVLFGTAAAGSLVEVRDQATGPVAETDLSPGVTEEVVLGTTAADRNGLWQLGPFAPLPPGQHVLTVYQLAAAGAIEVPGSPVVVTVLMVGEQGPLSLATPSIKFPTLGARLRSGQATFVGAGLPGMVVRLYLDNRQVGEGVVTTREEWRLTPEEVLAPGVHLARVAAVNPDGAIIAESAPVVFVVEVEPAAQRPRLPLPTPALPLTVSSLAFGDRLGQSLVVRGRATPHSGVSAWIDGHPIRFANALTDGGWQFWLFEDETVAGEDRVEIRTSLGERLVTEARPREEAVVLRYAPLLLSPLDGEVLTTRRPLVLGMAQPSSEVAVLVNGRVVARVVADRRGTWAYQLTDPLPAGYSVLAAEVEETWTTPRLKSRPVVVRLASQL